MISWPVELLELDRLHQEEERVSRGVVKAQPFGAHADEAAIADTQRALGSLLDPQHLEFLRHADGWEGFSGNIDLFGTADFLGTARFRQAQEWIKVMDRRVLGAYAKQRSELVPIGKSSASTDLLLMVKHDGKVQPRIFWFASELIEEFESFNQMFASFKGYVLASIDYWSKRK